jgi:hypothetical protein
MSRTGLALAFVTTILPTRIGYSQPRAPHAVASSAPPARITDIRTHDFRNGVFHVDTTHTNVTLHNGSWSGHPSEMGGADTFSIESIVYGDLDGDGIDEAAVSVQFLHADSSGQFNSIDVFAIRNGHVLPIARYEEGDRADGGIYDTEIREGRLLVRVFGTEASAHDPQWIDTQVLRLDGDRLVQERVIDRASYQLAEGRGPFRARLNARFPGGALIDGSCSAAPASAPTIVQWRARAHERFTISARAPAGTIEVRDASGSALARASTSSSVDVEATRNGDLTATLTCDANGSYGINVRRRASAPTPSTEEARSR